MVLTLELTICLLYIYKKNATEFTKTNNNHLAKVRKNKKE